MPGSFRPEAEQIPGPADPGPPTPRPPEAHEVKVLRHKQQQPAARRALLQPRPHARLEEVHARIGGAGRRRRVEALERLAQLGGGRGQGGGRRGGGGVGVGGWVWGARPPHPPHPPPRAAPWVRPAPARPGAPPAAAPCPRGSSTWRARGEGAGGLEPGICSTRRRGPPHREQHTRKVGWSGAVGGSTAAHRLDSSPRRSGDAKLLVTMVWRYSAARPVRYQSLR
jgi:hypothetical protein